MNLVTTRKNLEKYYSQENKENFIDREIVLDAIEKLVKQYIVPAMNVGSLNRDSIYIFDLDKAAGTEVHGLMLGLFESKLDGLNQPTDDALEKALQQSV